MPTTSRGPERRAALLPGASPWPAPGMGSASKKGPRGLVPHDLPAAPSTLPPRSPLQVRLEGRWCGVPGLLAGWGCPRWGVPTGPAASPTATHPASALEPGVTGAGCTAAGTVQRGRASSRTRGAGEARSVPETGSTTGEARVRWWVPAARVCTDSPGGRLGGRPLAAGQGPVDGDTAPQPEDLLAAAPEAV